MSYPRRRVTVIGGSAAALLVLGAVIVTSLHLAGAGSVLDTNKPVPAAKGATAGAATAFHGQLPQIPMASLRPAFADVGTSQAVSDVKADVVDDLQGLRSMMRLPANVAERTRVAQSGVLQSSQLLAQVVSATDATDSSASIQAAIKAVATDPSYRAYQDNKFIVVAWHGVKISGFTASVLLDGHDSYYDARGWADDPTRQWQLQLALESGRWKLVSQKSISIPPAAGPTASAKRP
jgi:hypothetical protein